MAKEKKLYAIKEECGCIWKTELNVNEIEEICYEGAGTEMADGRITIYFRNNYNVLHVDKIISE
jgi:hypothetical protein